MRTVREHNPNLSSISALSSDLFHILQQTALNYTNWIKTKLLQQYRCIYELTTQESRQPCIHLTALSGRLKWSVYNMYTTRPTVNTYYAIANRATKLRSKLAQTVPGRGKKVVTATGINSPTKVDLYYCHLAIPVTI